MAKRRRWTMPKPSSIGGAILGGLVIISALVIFFGVPKLADPKVPNAGQIPVGAPTQPMQTPGGPPSACALDQAARSDETRLNSPSPQLVVFGDSYVAGYGAAQPSDGFAYRLGHQLGKSVAAYGAAGSGFAAPGACNNQQYKDRLDALARSSAHASTVVVEGGLNDEPATRAAITSDAETFLTQLRSRTPARVVLVGPVVPSASRSSGLAHVTAAYEAAAAAAGVQFVDPSRWITAANRGQYIGPDHTHPNDAGHAYLARRLAAVLGG